MSRPFRLARAGRCIRLPDWRFADRRRRNRDDLLTYAIARAKKGDHSALHFLYVRFADQVCGHVQRIVADRHQAEEITQTVFTTLQKQIQRYERREHDFDDWILSVAGNTALDRVSPTNSEGAPRPTMAPFVTKLGARGRVASPEGKK